MILAHLADLHLGFSAYERHERGQNVREADVADVFMKAVEEVSRLSPDVVLVVGDVFDRPDPPSGALVTFARGIEALRAALPEIPVLVVAGPRDTPARPGDPGVLAAIDTVPGVEAVATSPRSVYVGEGKLHVHLLPHRVALGESSEPPTPDPAARWNVLVTHARFERGELDPPRDDVPGGRGPRIDPTAWDYVALGGEHVQRAPFPHVRWAGSLERVGWRPWEEALEEKGFFTYDLWAHRATFHPVPVRAMVSLAPIHVAPGDPEGLKRRVREVTDEVPGGIDGKVVLVRVQGAAPPDLAALTEDLLPGLRDRALYLSAVLEDASRSPRVPAEELRPRLTELLEDEGVAPEQALGRAASLLGETRMEAAAQ